MQQDSTVYDLGEVALDPSPRGVGARGRAGVAPVRDATRRAAVPMTAGFAPVPAFDAASTLSLLLPGCGHLARRQWAAGLFVISALGFLAVAGQAVLSCLDRITGTLRLLGYPVEIAVWSLAGIYGCAAFLHLWSVLSGGSSVVRAPHPALSGAASAVVPGWGQLLNGHLTRSALFLAALWFVGALWLLAAPFTSELLGALDLQLPPALAQATSPAVRWTLPAVIWSLSVYDAVSGAR